MAYGNYNPDEGQSSKFNAGLLQMARLDKLQDHINIANLNPLAFDSELGVYNYQTIVDNTTNLIEEAGNKLSKDEKLMALKMKEKMDELLEKYPIYKYVPRIKRNIPNMGNWKHIKGFVFYYQDFARGLLDKHDLNSPSDEDEGL